MGHSGRSTVHDESVVIQQFPEEQQLSQKDFDHLTKMSYLQKNNFLSDEFLYGDDIEIDQAEIHKKRSKFPFIRKLPSE